MAKKEKVRKVMQVEAKDNNKQKKIKMGILMSERGCTYESQARKFYFL
jgi:hypothetical protein